MAGVDNSLTSHLESKAMSTRMDKWAGDCGVAQPSKPEGEVIGQWGRSGKLVRDIMSGKGHR